MGSFSWKDCCLNLRIKLFAYWNRAHKGILSFKSKPEGMVYVSSPEVKQKWGTKAHSETPSLIFFLKSVSSSALRFLWENAFQYSPHSMISSTLTVVEAGQNGTRRNDIFLSSLVKSILEWRHTCPSLITSIITCLELNLPRFQPHAANGFTICKCSKWTPNARVFPRSVLKLRNAKFCHPLLFQDNLFTYCKVRLIP